MSSLLRQAGNERRTPFARRQGGTANSFRTETGRNGELLSHGDRAERRTPYTRRQGGTANVFYKETGRNGELLTRADMAEQRTPLTRRRRGAEGFMPLRTSSGRSRASSGAAQRGTHMASGTACARRRSSLRERETAATATDSVPRRLRVKGVQAPTRVGAFDAHTTAAAADGEPQVAAGRDGA